MYQHWKLPEALSHVHTVHSLALHLPQHTQLACLWHSKMSCLSGLLSNQVIPAGDNPGNLQYLWWNTSLLHVALQQIPWLWNQCCWSDKWCMNGLGEYWTYEYEYWKISTRVVLEYNVFNITMFVILGKTSTQVVLAPALEPVCQCEWHSWFSFYCTAVCYSVIPCECIWKFFMRNMISVNSVTKVFKSL